jgi:uncharacterized protein YciI
MYFLSANRPKNDIAAEEIGAVIGRHIEWTKDMIAKGIVKQSGKWGEIGGMTLLEADDSREARRIVESDPLVRSGLVTFELDSFYPDVPVK